jgi:hypothetical protein
MTKEFTQYSLAELRQFRQPKPVAPPTWLNPVQKWMTSVFAPRDHQKELHKLAVQSIQARSPNPVAHEILGIQPSDPNSKGKLRDSLTTFTKNSLNQFNLLQTFRQGVRFDLDLAAVPQQAASPSTPPASRRRDPVRYGLVLRNIEPNHRSLGLAATNIQLYELLASAPKARVKWTIDRLPPPPASRPYAVQPTRLPATSSANRPTKAHTVWQAIQHPTAEWAFLEPDFRGVLKNKGKLNDWLAGKMPPQILSLQQKSGFYAFELQSDQGFDLQNFQHQVIIPLTEHSRIYERRDQDGNIVARSLDARLGTHQQWHSVWTYQPKKETWVHELNWQGYGWQWGLKTQNINDPLAFSQSALNSRQYNMTVASHF